MDDTELYSSICRQTRDAKENIMKKILDIHIPKILVAIRDAASRGRNSIIYGDVELKYLSDFINKLKGTIGFNPFGIRIYESGNIEISWNYNIDLIPYKTH